ncbi:hypothetical protein [Sulfobacillus thermosulfidooxidans]|uniref:hypothetical protein n=1 Tax=Sulfobacillus thermosulfidooxidans TaxID=28034 RepID=UPI0006B47577|nr:hypothetical protein [Sulfobacillus thermosulfidooxidans]
MILLRIPLEHAVIQTALPEAGLVLITDQPTHQATAHYEVWRLKPGRPPDDAAWHLGFLDGDAPIWQQDEPLATDPYAAGWRHWQLTQVLSAVPARHPHWTPEHVQALCQSALDQAPTAPMADFLDRMPDTVWREAMAGDWTARVRGMTTLFTDDDDPTVDTLRLVSTYRPEDDQATIRLLDTATRPPQVLWSQTAHPDLVGINHFVVSAQLDRAITHGQPRSQWPALCEASTLGVLTDAPDGVTRHKHGLQSALDVWHEGARLVTHEPDTTARTDGEMQVKVGRKIVWRHALDPEDDDPAWTHGEVHQYLLKMAETRQLPDAPADRLIGLQAALNAYWDGLPIPDAVLPPKTPPSQWVRDVPAFKARLFAIPPEPGTPDGHWDLVLTKARRQTVKPAAPGQPVQHTWKTEDKAHPLASIPVPAEAIGETFERVHAELEALGRQPGWFWSDAQRWDEAPRLMELAVADRVPKLNGPDQGWRWGSYDEGVTFVAWRENAQGQILSYATESAWKDHDGPLAKLAKKWTSPVDLLQDMATRQINPRYAPVPNALVAQERRVMQAIHQATVQAFYAEETPQAPKLS